MRKSRPGQKSLSRTGFCAFPARLPDRGCAFPGGTGARNLPAVLEAYEDRMRRRALPTGRPCPAWWGAWGCREPRSTKSPRRAKARRGFADSGPDRSRQRGGGDIPPQETEDAFCHQGQKGAARRRAGAKPRAGGAGKHADERCQQSAHGRGRSAAEPGIRQGWRPLCPQHARQIGRQAAQTGGSGGRKKERRGGCGCGQGPVPGAQQGKHQSAQRRGTRKQAGRAQRQRFVGPAFLSRRADPPGGAATPQSSLCAGCGDCTSKRIYS